MESKHTMESPLKLTWTGSGYKVNKPCQENQELVSLEYAATLIEQNKVLTSHLDEVWLTNSNLIGEKVLLIEQNRKLRDKMGVLISAALKRIPTVSTENTVDMDLYHAIHDANQTLKNITL
jgi:hypothetical protein